MKISELELPQNLFTEEASPCGSLTRLIVPERLVSWAEEGCGDAISKLCLTVCEREMSSIGDWESERILQLEDDWMAAGSDEDNSSRKYEHVKRYHTTREDVAREAELKRASVKERLYAHELAIEKLVEEAREFVSAHEVYPEEDDMLAYLLVISIIVIACYALFN
jgi:hypothetical protein